MDRLHYTMGREGRPGLHVTQTVTIDTMLIFNSVNNIHGLKKNVKQTLTCSNQLYSPQDELSVLPDVLVVFSEPHGVQASSPSSDL